MNATGIPWFTSPIHNGRFGSVVFASGSLWCYSPRSSFRRVSSLPISFIRVKLGVSNKRYDVWFF